MPITSGIQAGAGFAIENGVARVAGAQVGGIVLLDAQILSSATATVTFSNISQDYDHLRLEVLASGTG